MPVNAAYYESPTFGAACVRMLLAAQHPDAERACKRAWLYNGWGPAEITVYPTQAKLPAAVGVVNDEQIFVGISGTDSFEQVKHYIDPLAFFGHTNHPKFKAKGFLSGFNPQARSDVLNTAFWDWGTTAARMVYQRDARAGRVVIFCGHSYGGAVAMAAAVQYRVSVPGAKVYCITFGAPKLGGASVVAPLNYCNYIAWVNELDPVPALPPSEGEIGFPLKILQRGVTYVVAPGYEFKPPGLLLFRNGGYRSGSPSNLTPTLIQVFANLGNSDNLVLEPSAHRLEEYRRRLELWDYTPPPGWDLEQPAGVLALAPRPPFFPPTPAAQLLVSINAAKQREQARARQVADAVKFAVFANGLSLFFGGDAMPYVPPEYVARKLKYAVDWGVAWEGAFIATGTRTQCHSLAKAFNHFLRRLQVMSGFDTDAFNGAVAVYVNEASAGGLGFKPDQLPIT